MPLTIVKQVDAQITSVKTLADRLKWARERATLTQTELAKKAGVAPGTIGNLEAGTRKNARSLFSIAKALHVTPEWLQIGFGEPGAAPVTSPAPGPGLELSAEELQLIQDFRELLPEDRGPLTAPIRAKADQMRRHTEMVLKRAGVTFVPSPTRGNAIPAAPPYSGPERRLHPQPVSQERRRREFRGADDLAGKAAPEPEEGRGK